MASKQRTVSPFKFKKAAASVNGGKPLVTGSVVPMLSPSQGLGSGGKSNNSNAIPRARLTPPFSPITPQKLYTSFNSPSIAYSSHGSFASDRSEPFQKTKENVTVTVRFRPLSAREIQKGDEVAWYADGDSIVQSEFNPDTSYAFDRVFGPATTTRHVYDIAAQHVIGGAMEGVNGTVFAYGVTSSGKTHTMHGDQKSPGIIPLAIKDVFSIIQETPGREFLLRVSYLEIYNEVINDLLDPAGQNLKVREDGQGTYVEGIKEEVILSPAHALSLIAAGEEHRHVGSNNFNLLSSRSHTIFTLKVESSPVGDNYSDEEVNLSQLNLIDLAGSESSKTETTGLRRKEGSYINKSLLTLGTVISKLTDSKATHIPYRDSKLTRLLQSSLSGHGRVSLICTVTPASSCTEETHNTLKFAHRAKHVEIHASQNKILDEKSLIKKYQKEICSLKQELEQVKRGMLEGPHMINGLDDLEILKQKLEAGQVKLQSRLEEEEQAKAALMGRIHRLTKLILVSTKNTVPTKIPERSIHPRRHSFGEEELAYLPSRRKELVVDDDDDGVESEISSLDGKVEGLMLEDMLKDEKKTKKKSVLGWFKLKKTDNGNTPASLDTDNSLSGSPGVSGTFSIDSAFDFKGGRRKSVSRRGDELTPVVDSFPEATQAGELFSVTVRGRRPPPTGTTMADQMDLLREQIKMLAGEVALCTSSLKRLAEQSVNNPDDEQLQEQMQKLKDETQEKRRQMQILERRMITTGEAALSGASALELTQKISKLTSQLNEKSFDLEIKTADNRILQEQLQAKVSENNELLEHNKSLQIQLNELVEKLNRRKDSGGIHEEYVPREVETLKVDRDNWSDISSKSLEADFGLQSLVEQQAAEMARMGQERDCLFQEKEEIEKQNQKLAEEAAYAKQLASAAAVELKNLAEEVTKLSHENTNLSNHLVAVEEELLRARHARGKSMPNGALKTERQCPNCSRGWRAEGQVFLEELKREVLAWKEKAAALESVLAEKELRERELQIEVETARRQEANLESDLAGMWVLVAQLKQEKAIVDGDFDAHDSFPATKENSAMLEEEICLERNLSISSSASEVKISAENLMEVTSLLEEEKKRSEDLETLLLPELKDEDLDGLDLAILEDLSELHVEDLEKLCQTKAQIEEKEKGMHFVDRTVEEAADKRTNDSCKVCFEAPTAAVLLPCQHFCLCKSCAVACTECPLCKSTIEDRIIT